MICKPVKGYLALWLVFLIKHFRTILKLMGEMQNFRSQADEKFWLLRALDMSFIGTFWFIPHVYILLLQFNLISPIYVLGAVFQWVRYGKIAGKICSMVVFFFSFFRLWLCCNFSVDLCNTYTHIPQGFFIGNCLSASEVTLKAIGKISPYQTRTKQDYVHNSWNGLWITLTPYMVLPLFATRFAAYAGGIRVSFIQPCLF